MSHRLPVAALRGLILGLAVLLGLATLAASQVTDESAREQADLAQARAVFAKNIRAIQQRNREDYLACYRPSSRLVRVGATGMNRGFEGLAAATPATDAATWPVRLVARDLRLAWLGTGLVYGTYRYDVDYGDATGAGLSERLFVETDDGWRIAVTSAFDAPPGTPAAPLALVGATVLDGAGGRIEDAVVVTRDGRIEAVGPRAETPIPDGVETVDLAGRFVTPGLVDTHVHYSQTGWADGRPDACDVGETHPYERTLAECRAHPERFHRAFLRCGVTAVFDVGGYPWTRGLGATTENVGDAPHVAATGPLLATWEPGFGLVDQRQFLVVDSDDDVRRAVRAHAAEGSAAVKFWFILRDPSRLEHFGALLALAVQESRARGLKVVVHATALETARSAVKAGAHLLVHSVEDNPVDDDFVAAAAASGIFYCPTLTVRRGYTQLYERTLSAEVEDQLAWVDPTVRDRIRLTAGLAPDPRFSPERLRRMRASYAQRDDVMAANLRRLHEAGVPIALGTDAGNPLTLHGPSVFPELEAMQAAGLSPQAVLTAATRDAARAMLRGDDLGLIAPGRIADLVVVEADPTADIAAMRRIRHVMRAGLLRARADL